MEKEKQKELIFKLSMFEQQIMQLQQQIESVGKGIDELNSLSFGLDDIDKSAGKEILSQLGKGVFVRSNLTSNELIVDIGHGNFVKKGIPETKGIIREQTEKLMDVRKELESSIEKVNKEASKALEEFRKSQQ